jgi:MFS family permease
VVLAVILFATLPFTWSREFSCDNEPMPTVTGVEILRGHGNVSVETAITIALWFLVPVLLPVVLGLLSHRDSRAWRRLASGIVSGLAALLAGTVCVMMGLHGNRRYEIFPAAWVGTLSVLGIAVDSWGAVVGEVRGLIERRRRERERRRDTAGVPVSPLRVAYAEPEPREQAEAEIELDVEPIERLGHR